MDTLIDRILDRSIRLLRIILILIAIHSFGFGLALIVLPTEYIEFFGFRLEEKFFAIQGGVFHLIICYAYLMGARDPLHSGQMIHLAILAKFSATVFLLCYYFFGGQIIMVLASGIVDFLMGLAILVTYRKVLNCINIIETGKSKSVNQSGVPL